MMDLDLREPRKHLFVLKQHYIPQRRIATVVSFAGPSQRDQLTHNKDNQRYMYQYAQQQNDYLSIVEHAVTREGWACVKFDVTIAQPQKSSQVFRKVLYIYQN